MYEAHGLGGGADLPIPANLAIAGGTAALTFSFVILLLAWRQPRFAPGVHDHMVAPPIARFLDGRGLEVGLRLVGMLLLGFTLWAATFGPDLLTNPTFGIVFVWLWVGIVPFSLAFGRVYRALNPARTIHLGVARLIGSAPDEGLSELPPWVGYWPAAAGLLAFVWYELAYPGSVFLGPLRVWFAIYFVVVVGGAVIFGDRWIARADPFEVYSSLVARLSPWGRSADGRLVIRWPLRNLATLPPAAGLVGVVSVLLGSTAWDSFRESTTWVRFLQTNDAIPDTVLNSLMLVSTIVMVGAVFTASTMATGVSPAEGGSGTPRGEIPRRLAHSIVPIIIGYMVAHYLTFFVEVGQRTLILASDPLLRGWDLFGTADLEINYWLSLHPTLLASVKVLAIVTGHVVGVVAAHDRALELLPRKHRVAGQLPLLVAMTLYTFGGLYLLFGA